MKDSIDQQQEDLPNRVLLLLRWLNEKSNQKRLDRNKNCSLTFHFSGRTAVVEWNEKEKIAG